MNTQLAMPELEIFPSGPQLKGWTTDDTEWTDRHRRPRALLAYLLCYLEAMRPVQALYENGLLRPAKPLNLRPGERVGVIVVRQADPARWDLARLAATSAEETELAAAGMADWAANLDHEDLG